MYWFIAGIIALLLGMFYKITNGSFGKQKVTTGTITKINSESKTICVTYNLSASASPITTEFTDQYDEFSKLTVGQRVLIAVNNSNPTNPVIALLYNKKSKDRSIKRSTNAAFIIAVICFIMGIINVIGL